MDVTPAPPDDEADVRPLSGSIVIPAHNEASVIGQSLGHLLRGIDPAVIEVVVVANGCSDSTAAVAREAAPTATVIAIDRPSKPEALRTGDRHATRMPRLYLDADVLMTGGAALATLDALSNGAVAARPPARYDTSEATWPIRRYYRARSAMPSLRAHVWGAGVYGLSATARGRFTEFPDVLGDDLWVDQLLEPGELAIVDTEPVIVRTPRDSRHLIRILRRSQRTKAEGRTSEAAGDTQHAVLGDLEHLARSGPDGLIDAIVYVGFALAARVAVRVGGSGLSKWERDDSSRAPVKQHPAG